MGYTKKRTVDLGELENEFVEKLPTFTNEELEGFTKFLAPFYVEKVVTSKNGPETIRVLDVQEAAVAFGAMSKRTMRGHDYYAVVMEPIDFDSNGHARAYKSPTMHQKFWNKLDQWKAMQNRRKFAEMKRMEGYEELAEGMRVEHEEEEPA